MKAKQPKPWKYEKDIQRIERLVTETVAESNKPAWGSCVNLVVSHLRSTKPVSTPLALHFISISAKEMLSGRHDNARLCLVVAMSVADTRIGTVQQKLFVSIFSRTVQQAIPSEAMPAGGLVGFIQNVMNQLAHGHVPEGAVDLGNGVSGIVMGVPMPPINLPDGGDPRRN